MVCRMIKIITTNRTKIRNDWTWLTSERGIKATGGWKTIAFLWKLSWAILFSPHACMTLRTRRLCLHEPRTSQAGEDSVEQMLEIWVWGKGRVALILTTRHRVYGRDGYLSKKDSTRNFPATVSHTAAQPGTIRPLLWSSVAMWLVLTNEIRACLAYHFEVKILIFYLPPVRGRRLWGPRPWQSHKLGGARTPESPPGGEPPAKYGTHIRWEQERILWCVEPLLGFIYYSS